MAVNSVINSVELLPTGRNGGMLLAGGLPGNKGGSGRPASAIRAELRDGLAAAMPRLLSAMRGEIQGESSVRAFEVAAKFALAEAKILLPEEFAEVVANVAVKYIPEASFEQFFADIGMELKSVGW